MQKELKDLLKILKSHRDLQKSASKTGRDNLNNFRNDLKLFKNSFESFKDASEGEIEFKDFNEDFNENQFKTK